LKWRKNMASALDTLLGLGNLVTQVRGQKQTTSTGGGKTTTTRNVDQEGIDRIVQRLVTGQGGQAAISGAARGAGLYNSTAERQQLNDLNARVAGEVADRTSGTTVTTDPQVTTVQTPGMGLGTLGGILGAATLGKGIMENVLGIGSPAAAAASAAPIIDLTQTMTPLLGQGFASTLSSAPGVLGSTLGSMDDFIPSASFDLSPGFLGGLGDIAGNIPVIGTVLSGLLGDAGDSFGASLGLSGLGMAAAGTPLAPVIPAVGLLGSLFSGGLSVVCTALAKQGLLDKAEYEAGRAYLAKMSPITKRGYYAWGVPLARKIDEGAGWAIRLSKPFAVQRTRLLAGGSAIKNPLGVLTKYVGEPICYMIGLAVTARNKLTGDTYGLRHAYRQG
jgi:hypothetical protein